MKTYFILILCTTLMFTSCNQDKINSLEYKLEQKAIEITELNTEIYDLKEKLNETKNKLDEIESEKIKIRHYTDEEIIEIVKTERSFNCPNISIKEFIVRKTSSDLYQVRFYQNIFSFGLQKKHWEKIIVEIQIYPKNKYRYNVKVGTLCN